MDAIFQYIIRVFRLREAQLRMLLVWDCQCVRSTGGKHSRGAVLISASCCYSLVSGYCIEQAAGCQKRVQYVDLRQERDFYRAGT